MEEVSFPRGGKVAVKKPKEANVVKRKTSNNENLFKVSTAKKRKRQKNKAKDPDAAFLGITKKLKKASKVEKAKGNPGKAIESAEPLSHKLLVDDMTVLARIQDVRDAEILVSLPGRILGTVPLNNVSKPYSSLMQKAVEGNEDDVKGLKEMFNCGETVTCAIKSAAKDGSFKVIASLNPADLHKDLPASALATGMRIPAAVQSVEDRGYIMDVGIPNVRAFLPGLNQNLAIGQVVACLITRAHVDGSTANLNLALFQPDQSQEVPATDLKVATLLPGTPVKCTVEKVLANGLVVSFNQLKGYIHKDHFPELFSNPGKFTAGQTLRAVVLYTLPLVNAIYLTLKSSIVGYNRGSKPELKLGEIVENAKITEATNAGLFLQLNKHFKGYIPVRHLKDSGNIVEDVHLTYPVGSSKRCRILQYSYMDEVYICTIQKSLLKQEAIRYEDFSVGQAVKAKVETLNSNGVIVSLGKNLQGFIPRLHWADDPRLKKPEFRFHTSVQLDCRVLKCDSEKKQVLLTCKKSIIEDEKSIVWSLEQLKPGLRLQGTVTLVQKHGLLVSFFGELCGWIPKQSLAAQRIEDATRNFYLGQIVKCTVKNVNESSGKVTLALGSEDTSVAETLPLGTYVSCRVETVVKDPSPGLEVSVVDSGMKGFVPLDHLSDFPFLWQPLLQSYTTGHIVEAIVWKQAKPEAIFSMKQSLVRLAKENGLPKTLEDIRVGSVYPCVFSSMQDFGAFADLLRTGFRQTALFPKSRLQSGLRSFLETRKEKFTLYGKVLTAKIAQKKIALTSEVDFKDQTLLENLLKDLDIVQNGLKNDPDEEAKAFANIRAGDPLVGRVEEKVDGGITIKLESGITVLMPEYHCAGRKLKKNDLIVGATLYCDVLNKTVYGTLRNEILTVLAAKKNILTPGASAKGVIIYKGEFYGLVLLKGKFSGFAYLPLIDNLNNIYDNTRTLVTVGDEVDVVVVSTGNFPVVRIGKAAVERKRKLSETAAAVSPEAKKKKQQQQTKKQEVKLHEKTPEQKVQPSVEVKTIGEPLRLQVTSQFQWDDDVQLPLPGAAREESSSESEDSDAELDSEKTLDISSKDRKERARQKREKARAEESSIAAAEQNLLTSDSNPQTADDFDRLVLSSPDSSILWLRYMAFHLENAEIDQARAVVQRALKTINFREEQEKFNIWIAWLNLEHLYGTTESYDKVFEEALRCNEPLKIYKQMALNFAQSGKFEEAQNLFSIMMKKFKRNKEVWISVCIFYMKNSKPDSARDVFQRSLLSIEKKEHVDMISRFAQLEAKYGELERSKTMFDTLLVSYPKRTDLWLVYVDTLTKAGDIEGARQVLERAASLQMTPKKMKAIFQKYLDFEAAHGDEELQENVRQKALSYIESKNAVDE